MGRGNFQKEYRKLNNEQKEAVNTIEGPVMVVAGPGTGKTQIIALRILNILEKTDTTPDSILALTFTEAGVLAMRKRLTRSMGSDAYRVGIYTFHGFASGLISRYPDYYPRIIGSKNIGDIDKIILLKEIIKRTKLEHLKPFGDPYYYLHSIRSYISELKRENISPKEALKKSKDEEVAYQSIRDLRHEKGAHKGKIKGVYKDLKKQIEKNKELVRVFSLYEKALKEKKFYDYEDMIIETVHALESHADFLLSLQEQYHYILADEHQDANNSQNRILELLLSFHDNPNLFLVGDEKQAIYRFQGASLENFLYFSRKFPEAKLVQLHQNYRSRQGILDGAHSLITKGPLSEHENLEPLSSNIRGKNVHPEIFTFSLPEFEYLYIAEKIKKLIQEGVEAPHIAVLYRNNNDVHELLPALERKSIPYNIESEQDVLGDIDMRKFIHLLHVVSQFGNKEKLAMILHIDFLGLDSLDVYKFFRAIKKERISSYELIQSKVLLKKAGIKKSKDFISLYQKLSSWSVFGKNRSLLETIECIARESGFWGHVLTHDRAQVKLDAYSGFIRDIEQLVETHRTYTLSDLIEYINLLGEHNILIRRSRRYARVPSIRLMTAHKAKGLEFDYVFIPNVSERKWGKKRISRHFSLLDISKGDSEDLFSDERRLFYVALTRARHGAFISYAQQGFDGRDLLPSPFIEEIEKEHRTEEEMSVFERNQKPETLLSPRDSVLLPATEKAYLKELFLEQGLSVSALNNYLLDPWKYFFGNLLRIPKAPNRSMLYGTAIHAALHDFFEKMKEGKKPNKAYLLRRFREGISRLSFGEHDYKESLMKGGKALSKYFDTYHKTFSFPLENEFSIVALLPLEGGEQVRLRGILDKIEMYDEETVRVVDYKTGAPRTRNDILGKTKSSQGDYFRQLVFYKLLLSLSNTKYKMHSGVIDFIEPNQKGKHIREEFFITDKDVEELKQCIQKSAKEIISFSFWDKACDPKKSDFCDLQKILFER